MRPSCYSQWHSTDGRLDLCDDMCGNYKFVGVQSNLYINRMIDNYV